MLERDQVDLYCKQNKKTKEVIQISHAEFAKDIAPAIVWFVCAALVAGGLIVVFAKNPFE